MMIRWSFSVFLIFSFLLVSSEGAAAMSDRVAMITSIKGRSEVVGSDGNVRAVTIGTLLYVGDCVKTSRSASIKITFIDRSTVSLAGNAELVIDDYLFKKGEKPRSSLTIQNGVFRFMAGKISKIAPENYKINTETATIGIRGSGGVGKTSSEGLEIAVLPGHILEVVTKSGEVYLLDDPKIGLRVDGKGHGTVFLVDKVLKQAPATSQLPSLPISEEYPPIPWYFHREKREKIHNRRFILGKDLRLLGLFKRKVLFKYFKQVGPAPEIRDCSEAGIRASGSSKGLLGRKCKSLQSNSLYHSKINS